MYARLNLMFQNQSFKMPLNLTRAVATQSIRTFSHQGWVSGENKDYLTISNYVILGPPRTRIPFAEKVVHGVLISAGVLAGPMYILCNIESYKKRD